MFIRLNAENEAALQAWWDRHYGPDIADPSFPPCKETDERDRCTICHYRKNLWIEELLDDQVVEYVPVPEIPTGKILLDPKDAIIIHNIISTMQVLIMDTTDDSQRMTFDWLVGYLGVRGIAPIQERLYAQVKEIDTDALIKTGE